VELEGETVEVTIGEAAEGMEEREAPFIQSGRTMVPLRYISGLLGFDVVWDPEAHTITINSAE